MNASNGLPEFVRLTRELKSELRQQIQHEPTRNGWAPLAARFARQTGRTSLETFSDALAQSIACGIAVGTGAVDLSAAARSWLIAQADPLVQCVLRECWATADLAEQEAAEEQVPEPPSVTHSHPPLHAAAKLRRFVNDCYLPHRGNSDDTPTVSASLSFYEQFLQAYDRDRRRRQGVFFTPAPVAGFVVEQVDKALRDEFNLGAGLLDNRTWSELAGRGADFPEATANTSQAPFLRILDPAMGTGVFLLEVIRLFHRRFLAQGPWRTDLNLPVGSEWDDVVEQSLLPRLFGFELMLPALVLAQLRITMLLAETGYSFRRRTRLQLYLLDTMQSSDAADELGGQRHLPFPIVLGNPPFSGISDNRRSWIRALLRGKSPHHSAPVADYFSVDGQPLGERKHWLEDDYVKFLRFAHWQIERAGLGILGLVTNHAYLDNSTFRGLRHQLLNSFRLLTFVDLHGNMRRGVTADSDLPRDESVFQIGQGVAVCLLRTPPTLAHPQPPRVEYVSLPGSRSQKLHRLKMSSQQALESVQLSPSSPHYLFVPRDESTREEYEQGVPLTELMPIHSTAAVTARDALVVALDRQELTSRMHRFRNLELPDDEIREEFFQNGRSRNYPAGDTRGWRMSVARQRMAADEFWHSHIRECLYRPFDRRAIFWADWMIDWPRNNVMQHLVDGRNLAIIARRQSPVTQPGCYFWVTDTIALDGVIRSDHRGSESVFPLFLEPANSSPHAQTAARSSAKTIESSRPVNFSTDFLARCQKQLGCPWRPIEACRAGQGCGPNDLLCYIYGLFHAPSYRERYAAWLPLDFPRVLLPARQQLFWQISRCGQQLIEAHLGQQTSPPPRDDMHRSTRVEIAAGFPKYEQGQVWANRQVPLVAMDEPTWKFRVGTYQVCRKWLKDRRRRELDNDQLARYRQLVAGVQQTLKIMRRIDRSIHAAGGWPAAFRLDS
jgi:predicted helicase